MYTLVIYLLYVMTKITSAKTTDISLCARARLPARVHGRSSSDGVVAEIARLRTCQGLSLFLYLRDAADDVSQIYCCPRNGADYVSRSQLP